MIQDTLQRFNSRYIPVTESGCWLWLGTVTKRGYGQFSMGGRMKSAHRVSYSLFKSPITEGTYVCHRCDEPTCVRPDHLFLGTPKENVADCKRKNRWAFGEKKPNSKINMEIVKQIRKSNASEAELGKRFGISATLAGYIKRKQRWSWV